MTDAERLALMRMLAWLGEHASDPQLSGTYARLAAFYAGEPGETKH